MAGRTEYVNISGLRVDGRRPKEVRRIACQLGVLEGVDGSAMIEMGNTRVLAVVYGPMEVRRRAEAEHDEAIINCEFGVAPFATTERRKRRPGDRKLLEASSALKQVFETVVLTKQYPRSQIDIHIQVLQSDGAVQAAAINAASLALSDAGIAMRDVPVACSTLYVQRTILVDPNFTEGMSGGPELVVALLPRSGKVTMATMDSRLPLEQLDPMLELASAGCRQIHDIARGAMTEHTRSRLEALG